MVNEAAAIAAFLRDQGIRATPQRRAIWAAFEGGGAGHLTAEDVLKRARRDLPEVSRGTVYNALAEFVAAGLLSTVDGPPSVLYDPNVEEHQHFRCRRCGRLYDVHASGVDTLRLDDRGFLVERQRVVFEGLCGPCRGE